MACSNVRNRSVFADRVDSKVEILDTDGKLLKRIMFISQGDKERQQYSKDESEGVTYYTFLGSVKQSFTDVCCNDSTIALLYRPGLITPSSVSISDAEFYFARPYHSWERGANENTNGLIRQYIPKGTDFSELTDEMIAEIEWKLNSRPRKSLGYLTPIEYCKLMFNFDFGVRCTSK